MKVQSGLKWVSSIWDSKPTWTTEPDIDLVAKVASRYLQLPENEAENTTIEFVTQGAFNKLYKMTCSRGSFAMRVTLPVDPRFKTSSEAAMLDLVSKCTSIPVSKVIAMDNSANNDIGFEWILMDFAVKCKLVKNVVNITAALFRIRPGAIGSIYRASDMPEFTPQNAIGGLSSGFVIGRLVSMPFFWDKHLFLDIPRGPYPSSSEWLAAILVHKKHDCDQAAQDMDNDDEDENEMTRVLIERLSALLPKVFPPIEDPYEEFALHHDDQ